MINEQCRELTNRLIDSENKWMVASGESENGEEQ